MIDNEIKIIIDDMYFHTNEILNFLRRVKNPKYKYYIEDLIDYALSTQEDIKTLQQHIYELETRLYYMMNGGDFIE